MILNRDQIVGNAIVQQADNNQFGNASYDLSVGKIIDMDGQEHTSLKLEPQGMVYVIFAERLVLPEDVIGFAHVRTTLTKRGILATNIGIIDPTYDGYVSTLLINFGSTAYMVLEKERALRVTFFKFDKPNAPNKALAPLSEQEYSRDTKRNTDFLDKKFLNLSNVEKEVSKTLIQRFFTILALFGVASFFVAVYFQFKNSQSGDTDRAIKRYETELNLLQDQHKLLEKQIVDLQDSIRLHR